ncbi:MAG TPA: mannosyltransferase family protein [Gemmataceae bacterium]|jgi:hypothetical protein|nr:mannosyltransferase family protein [Gemmataceae bacterium]
MGRAFLHLQVNGADMDKPASNSELGPGSGRQPTTVSLWDEALGAGSLFYFLTSVIAVFGVVIGHQFVIPADTGQARQGDLLSAFAAWDGQWYSRIVMEGYTYDRTRMSSVVFFPGYPVFGQVVVRLTGWSPERALLIVSHLSLAAAFVLMAAYARRRFPQSPRQVTGYVLLSMGLLPTTFFFRMAYSESLFLALALLAMYGMERRWPLLVVALVVGLATAARPVGVALLAPLLLHVWHRSATLQGFVLRFVCLVPIGCWGLGGYVLYQHRAFGEPLAFVQAERHWRMRPAVPLAEKLAGLGTFEPIECVFDRSSPGFWGRRAPRGNPWFNLQIANPIFFVLASVLLAVGGWQRWLSPCELAFGASALLIPYVTKGYEMCMGGMGRYAAVAFPIYLVLGQLLGCMPAPVAAGVLAVSGFLMGAYAALFAAGYFFI